MPNAIFLVLSSCNTLGWGITQMDLKSSGFSPRKSQEQNWRRQRTGTQWLEIMSEFPTANISEPWWGTFQHINLLVLTIWNKLLRLDIQTLSTTAWSLPYMWVKFLGLTTSHLHSLYTHYDQTRAFLDKYNGTPTVDKAKDSDTKSHIRADS